ncbi:Protein flp [Colletotrichum chlorophyti]|uniref:Protein flp n=1 Tax=Colletotrichum chlorophyti TaxID=708187 RepID=A0A1Q8RTB1_9PEZI|nr:Protein flp [Colletotrichum chlorophyti]
MNNKKLLGLSFTLSLVRSTLGDGAAQQPLHENGEPRAASPNLDAYIEGIMEEWHTPGLTVAVVDGNDTWAKGYGYAVINSTRMTPHTLFYTGSTTKSFTAAGLSLLIDKATANGSTYSGLNWQTPVSSILRDDFVLSDEWATAHVTLEDALSHRSGYPRHDLASAETTRETVRLLRHLPMSAEPRMKFQYSNKMFAAMGYLIEVLTGSWLGDFFREHLWEPMGMNETYFSLQDAESSGLVLADEYFYDVTHDKYITLSHEPSSGEEGAGSIISTVLDYAKYLRVMITEARPLSRDGHREIKTPRNFVAASKPPYVGPVAYAFGWNQAIFEGELLYFHSGQVGQFLSTMMMIPSKQLAVAVFANTESKATQLIAHEIMWEYLGTPYEKRFNLNKQYKSEVDAQLRYLKTCSDRIYPSIPDPPLLPTLPLTDHVGEYYDPGYGTLKVDLDCSDAPVQCKLRILGVGGVGFAYLEPALYLTHRSGDYWAGRGFVGGKKARDVDIPSFCVPAEFKIDIRGVVTHLGVGVRLEGDDGPLVWFKRVETQG